MKKTSPEAGAPCARDMARRLLARRSHSRAELAHKLARRGCPPDDILRALEELEQAGYLNDAEAAARWAEVLVQRRGWGPRKIAAYLARRGIDESSAQQAQLAVWGRCREEDIARRALARHFAAAPPVSKALAFLRARGFSAEVIYAVVCRGAGDDEAGTIYGD